MAQAAGSARTERVRYRARRDERVRPRSDAVVDAGRQWRLGFRFRFGYTCVRYDMLNLNLRATRREPR